MLRNYILSPVITHKCPNISSKMVSFMPIDPPSERMRLVHDYANIRGFIGGFPDFYKVF